ncbi:phospholipase D family protein [Candidatus Erwinia haradaeae]|uniref:phospholipase D n=1 Tax=Candidatus Erwinia haradaeae TaxID=1922217 RepID=A0A451DAY3_9GAMM|nr:phospholipase D family protein [Candidatus Erwinia haradaeae]VFP83473.1 PLD-like domain-containing protein [Candidatus Erwinia haradaeae]
MNSKLLKIKISFIIILLFFITTSSFPLLASTSIEDIKIGFSPGEGAKQIVLLAISEAKKSIDIAAYSFTSKPIALALLDAQSRGVSVRLVADKKSNSNRYTAATYLSNHRIPVKLNEKYAIMHNKFMIIDGYSVETGSFNYTQSAANRNAENVIYLRHQSEIAEKYMKEFDRLWKEATYISPSY